MIYQNKIIEKGDVLPLEKTLNFFSFICTLLCLLIFLLCSFSPVHKVLENLIRVNPFNILFYLVFATLLVSIIGLTGINNRTSAIRSIFTLAINIVLIVALLFIILIGGLFE